MLYPVAILAFIALLWHSINNKLLLLLPLLQLLHLPSPTPVKHLKVSPKIPTLSAASFVIERDSRSAWNWYSREPHNNLDFICMQIEKQTLKEAFMVKFVNRMWIDWAAERQKDWSGSTRVVEFIYYSVGAINHLLSLKWERDCSRVRYPLLNYEK